MQVIAKVEIQQLSEILALSVIKLQGEKLDRGEFQELQVQKLQ